MATIIRGARISDQAVTLVVQDRSAAEVRQTKSAEPMPRAQAEENAIRRPAAQTNVRSAQPKSLSDERLLSEIQQRERVLKERESRLEEGMAAERQKILEDAYAEGYKKGESDGALSYQERLSTLARVIDSAKEQFSGDIAGMEDMIVSVVFEAVCKIVGASLHERDGVIALVREVVNHAKAQEKLLLRVAPEEHELLQRHRAKLFGERNGIKHEIVPDDRVVMGGCLIETSGGTIDGRLEAQLQLLRDTLISARKMIVE